MADDDVRARQGLRFDENGTWLTEDGVVVGPFPRIPDGFPVLEGVKQSDLGMFYHLLETLWFAGHDVDLKIGGVAVFKGEGRIGKAYATGQRKRDAEGRAGG